MAIYTPLYKTLAAVRQYKPSYQAGGKQRGLSQYEQALVPKIQEAEAGRERKFNLLQPIELVFDLLSRGQYMTANTAKQITRNIREGRPALEGVPREVWEGLIGKEKGDWSTVLWGGQDKGGEQFQGWGQKAGENLEKTWIGRRAKGAAALAVNIAFDPTTYIGFGPAAGAKSAAREATEDAVKIATRKLAAEVTERLAGKGIKEVGESTFQKGMQEALEKGAGPAQKYLARYLGRDVDREMSQLIKQVRKEAIRQPAAKLRTKMLGEAESVMGRLKESKLDIMAQAGRPYAEAIDVLMDQAPELKDLSGIITKLKAGETYKGAGTRALRFMRKEFAVSERYPAIIHAWDKAAEAVSNSKVGTLFNNAWWSIMNDPRSPLATIKKAFNIRTPYQQYLANLQLDKTAMAPYLRDEYARNYFNAVKDLKPEDKMVLRDAWSQIQRQPDANILDTMLKSGVDAKQAAKIEQAYVKTQSMFNDFDAWFKKKYAEDPSLFPNGEIGTIANYLPMVGKRAGGLQFFGKKTGISPVREGFMKKRMLSFGDAEDLEKQVWRVMEPRLTDEQIEMLVKEYNMTRYLNMDLDEMVLARSFAQARAQQNVAIIEQFRQFGLNLNELKASDSVIAEALSRGAGDFGLMAVPDSRLEGYLFDPSVGAILKNLTSATESDATIRQFEKYVNSFTSWWKGWATLSPGFHFRNYYSNTVTGFLKHGTEWLNPDTQFRAGVATLYGLYGEDAFKYYAKMGLSEDAARQLLGQKIGDYTVGELAQLARQRGIITRAQMGFDAPGAIEDFTKQANWNPLSPQFTPMTISRDIGTIIESQPRFLSFLLDYRRSASQGVATETAIDYAGWEAKKWFIDYTDLSPFEQKVLKNIIPFYTWMRKNIANQITGMMEFKEMYALIPKIAAGGPEAEAMPDYMREAGYFPIRQLLGPKEGFMQMLWPNLPYMDINKIPLKFEISDAGIPIPKFEGKEILNDILSNAHPVVKTAFELLPEEGWDVYYRRPLGEEREAPRLLSKLSRVVAANPKILQFLDGFLVNIGVEEGLSGKLDDKGRLMINAKLARFLDNNLPFLQKLNQYIELPEYLTETVRSAREQTRDEKDAMLRAEKGLNVLSFYLGIKLKNVDEQAELGRQGDEILREAEEALRKERKGLPQYQQARLRYMQSRLLRKRKLGVR